MSISYIVTINSTEFSIYDLVNSKDLFSSDFNYLFFDPNGQIIFPSTQTMSGLNYNLTYRFDDIERVVPNPLTGNSLPTAFDVYHAYFRSLNEVLTPSDFVTTLISNVELPSISSGEPGINFGGDGVGDGVDGGTGDGGIDGNIGGLDTDTADGSDGDTADGISDAGVDSGGGIDGSTGGLDSDAGSSDAGDAGAGDAGGGDAGGGDAGGGDGGDGS
jgi:hypothetical protein